MNVYYDACGLSWAVNLAPFGRAVKLFKLLSGWAAGSASPSDKKRIAREIATSDPECRWTESALAEKLGVIQQTVNTWILDIRARQKAGRNTVIVRLNRLGWTQEMIAKVVGLDRGVISRNVRNSKISDMHNLLSQGHDMDYIARHYHMDFALVWALWLEGKTDQEKLSQPSAL